MHLKVAISYKSIQTVIKSLLVASSRFYVTALGSMTGCLCTLSGSIHFSTKKVIHKYIDLTGSSSMRNMFIILMVRRFVTTSLI